MTPHLSPLTSHLSPQFATVERSLALELDTLANSHPIEIPDGVQHPGQIDEIFDDISYSKVRRELCLWSRVQGGVVSRRAAIPPSRARL